MAGPMIFHALAATVAPMQAEAPVIYVVKPGDTLIDLGKRFLTPAPWEKAAWRTVQRVNRLRDPFHMPVGFKLKIPAELLRIEPLAARVIAFRGPVTINGAPAALGAPVGEGTTIATGANGSVTVQAVDGSRFSLPSQSAVSVARLRRVVMNGALDRRFNLQRGRSEWHAPPAPTPDSRFMVTTPVSVSAVRGTGFRVNYESGASTGVVEGVVGVSDAAGARTEAVPRGSSVTADATGLGALGQLLDAPKLDRPGAVQSTPMLAFTAQPVAGATGYVFELGTDAGLYDRFAEQRIAANSAQFEGLPDGRYFVRLMATDNRQIDGFAGIYSFVRLSFSGEAAAVDLDSYRFRWEGGAGANSLYRFSLATDQAMTRPMIDRDGLSLNQITVTNLKPGTYWWRVTVTKFEDGQAVTAVNEPQSFTIAPRG